MSCCEPTAYAGGSGSLVHGPLCDRADEPLTTSEYEAWLDARGVRRVRPRVPFPRSAAMRRHPAKGPRIVVYRDLHEPTKEDLT